ncbi:MAG TPA: peptidoglycan DD-metalloendopeptidase family protein [Stellaceae bacterium]|nr:peptidoglycan DD-metalloendopeptidase family protein [Stellaceae bacterium]
MLGLLVFWALVVSPTAGARLPATSRQPVPMALQPSIAPPAAALPPPARIATVTVRPGDSLMSLLQRIGLSAVAAQSALDSLGRKWDPRNLKSGQEIAVSRDPDGVKQLRLAPDLQHDLTLKRGGDGNFTAALLPRDLLHVPLRVAGKIDSSLFRAASRSGLPQAILAELIAAFSYDVDFQRELQPGDRFEVLFDQLVEERTGKIVGAGEVAYAALILSGKTLQLYRYTPPGGLPGFYDASGANVKKALLRTPVDGARISSGFGMRRHPILGFTRMHQGVDFAVPTGTPIMASGDAVVASAGWNSGYGNLVVLKHNAGYSTAYAHMSRFAKGIKPGVHVRQGEVIGYVGMTGLATGPHLHYEVRVDNKPINPLSVKLLPSQKLEGRTLAAFHRQETAVMQRLAVLRTGGSKLARN